MPLHGAHQGDNASIALDRGGGVLRRAAGAATSWPRGSARCSVPGRFEVLGHQPLVIVDGAHNPTGRRHVRPGVLRRLRARGPADPRRRHAARADGDARGAARRRVRRRRRLHGAVARAACPAQEVAKAAVGARLRRGARRRHRRAAPAPWRCATPAATTPSSPPARSTSPAPPAPPSAPSPPDIWAGPRQHHVWARNLVTPRRRIAPRRGAVPTGYVPADPFRLLAGTADDGSVGEPQHHVPERRELGVPRAVLLELARSSPCVDQPSHSRMIGLSMIRKSTSYPAMIGWNSAGGSPCRCSSAASPARAGCRPACRRAPSRRAHRGVPAHRVGRAGRGGRRLCAERPGMRARWSRRARPRPARPPHPMRPGRTECAGCWWS